MILSTGGRAWLPGGHAWLPGGVHGSGGMRGCPGACVVAGGVAFMVAGGHVWLPRGACVVAGGHVWLPRGAWVVAWGVCVVARGACVVAGGPVWLLGGPAWLWGVCMAGGHAWDTTRYGQWTGDTHPTGMHSCLKVRGPVIWDWLNTQGCQTIFVRYDQWHKTVSLLSYCPNAFFINQCDFTLSAKLIHGSAALF